MTQEHKADQGLPATQKREKIEKPTLIESISIVKWLLEWAAKSWQNLVTFVVLSSVIGIGFWAYTMPDSVRKLAIQSFTQPVVELKKIESVQTELLEQTGAVGYSVDLVDFEQNLRSNIVFKIESRDVSPQASRVYPVFPRDSPTVANNVVKLIHGQVVCFTPDAENASKQRLDIYATYGIQRVCSVGLPPGYTSYFKGILTVYFKEDIAAQQENVTELVLTRMSKKIMSDSKED